MSLSDIAVLNIKGSLYCFIISLISKIQAKGLMQNADLTEKTGILKIKKTYKNFQIIYKNEKSNNKI